MSHEAYLIKKIQSFRSQNMLGLRVRVDRAAPNMYKIQDRPGPAVCGFLSCSYLGLEWDERLARAAASAAYEYGTQFSSSRAVACTDQYTGLEERLGTIGGVPALVSSTSTLGHLSAIPILVRESDAAILDAQVHHSVQMAAQLCAAAGSTVVQIPHNDLGALEARLQEFERVGRERIWYLADGLYSMYGDYADMDALLDLMRRYKSLCCYVDDAHSTAWMGRHGEGHAAQWFAHAGSDRLVVVGSFAKAFGAGGGVLWMRNDEWREAVGLCGQTMIFCGPIQPPVCGALLAACDILLSDELPGLQAQLRDNIEFFGRALKENGLSTLSSGSAPIFLVEVGSLPRLEQLSAHLLSAGYYTPPVTYPAVALNKFCIRIVLNRLHTREQMAGLVETIARFDRDHPRQVAGRSPAGVAAS